MRTPDAIRGAGALERGCLPRKVGAPLRSCPSHASPTKSMVWRCRLASGRAGRGVPHLRPCSEERSRRRRMVYRAPAKVAFLQVFRQARREQTLTTWPLITSNETKLLSASTEYVNRPLMRKIPRSPVSGFSGHQPHGPDPVTV
jgi:hypothetical protein